jgi:hypothetical protein
MRENISESSASVYRWFIALLLSCLRLVHPQLYACRNACLIDCCYDLQRYVSQILLAAPGGAGVG